MEETEKPVQEKPKRITVVGIVRAFLTEHYEQDKFHEMKFDDINKLVREKFPNSKFNPYHLAHYKHKFLVRMDYVKMHRKQ
jgi:hypothetical protein